MRLKTWLLDLLFPPKCPICGKLLSEKSEFICTTCLAALPRVPSGDAVKVDYLSRVVSPVYYEKTVRESFLRYKFQGRSSYSTAYAVLLSETVDREFPNGVGYEYITWIPLSRKRLRKRGYDQSRLLAEKVGENLGKPVVPTLKKTRNTKVQSTLKTAEERRGNISGSYTVLNSAAVRDKRILLVDDILTTGATMSECARVLLLAGAESICGATFARKRNESKEIK